jgi:peptidoglycan/xylan/chitin deacetylase (PgdA/CDA1 family)
MGGRWLHSAWHELKAFNPIERAMAAGSIVLVTGFVTFLAVYTRSGTVGHHEPDLLPPPTQQPAAVTARQHGHPADDVAAHLRIHPTAAAAEIGPRLAQDVTAYYAPGPGSTPFGTLTQGTPYTLRARYGWDWLQAEFAGHGLLWVWVGDLGEQHTSSLVRRTLPNLAPAAVPGRTLVSVIQPQHTDALETHAELPARYAPEGDTFGTVASGTPYDLIARYHRNWVQADFVGHGLLWAHTADLGLAGADTSALPNLAPVIGYGLYIVAPGDTLQRIADMGGSDATLISHYNQATEPLTPGRPLIVPTLEGQQRALPPTPFIVRKGSEAQPCVAITVDVEMGDINHVLRVLRERNARVTFFVTGRWAQAHPAMLRQMVADGHELGNHSLDHPDFRTISNARIIAELAETERIVHEITGSTTRPLFRPPYGGYDDRVLQTVIGQGYLPMFWTVDSQDALGMPKSPEFLVQQITSSMAPEHLPGTITLSHCCAPRHVIGSALPGILDRFAQHGISACTLSDAMGN